LNDIVAANPNREIHVVLDNLNTHKPKEDRWLKVTRWSTCHFIPNVFIVVESGGMLVQHPQSAGRLPA